MKVVLVITPKCRVWRETTDYMTNISRMEAGKRVSINIGMADKLESKGLAHILKPVWSAKSQRLV
jgi:hypothetical protein